MSRTHPELAALIGSRICHDLISPIGAINNGLELLGMSGTTNGPEMNLLTDSVDSASARIKFFRLAFGAAGQQDVPNGDVARILLDISKNTKIRVNWNVEQPAPRCEVRLALLAEQCVETSMPYGGEIAISRDVNGWSVRGISDKFNIDERLWHMLADGELQENIAPAHVHFALLAVLCRDENRVLRTDLGQDEVVIRF